MHDTIGWLLKHYEVVTLWMGLETEDGAELYLTCSPSQSAEVVARLNVTDRDYSVFDAPAQAVAGVEG